MSYATALQNDLITALAEEFGAGAVKVYRGEISSIQDIEHTMGAVLRGPQVRVQLEDMGEDIEDSTGSIVTELWTFQVLAMAGNQRNEEEQEEDALQVVDRIRETLRGRRPSFAGYAGYDWRTRGIRLEVSVPGLACYSISVTVDTMRELNEPS